ncbi:hypothetical protein [Kribbella sp. CA-294648]|uniref:hypothetical protein n=1 Tax=Kribbella sp. CA-294648 TaxID=3239948 RepID=UPI003D8E437E
MTDATPATPEEIEPADTEHRLAVGDFKHLPPPVKLEDTIATHDPNAPADPTFGRDPQTDFLLRNAG